MSIETYVLSNRRLHSIDQWQAAIAAQEFDLRLDRSRPFNQLQGHLPAWRGDRDAGFECDHWEPDDIFECYPDIDFGNAWTCVLAFRFGGDFHALWGANAAAAAYAQATDGVVFDSEAGEVLSPDQAITTAREYEALLESDM